MTPAVLAHGFGIRYDLPVPLQYFLVAGGAVVALSFALVAVFVREREAGHGYPRVALHDKPIIGPLVRSQVPRAVFGTVGVLTLVAIVVCGYLGSPHATDNPAEYLMWIYFWAAMVPLVGLVGNVFALLNPWSALYDVGAHWLGRPTTAAYPEHLGRWPAVVTFLLFAFFELASGLSSRPVAVATAALAYTVYTLTMMSIFGRDKWLSRGEVFSILFGFVGAFGPVEAEGDPPDRKVWLRPYAAGLTRLDMVGWDIVAFVVLMLSGLAFDGLSATGVWVTISDALAPLSDALDTVGPAAVKGLGLLGVTGLFALVYIGFIRLVERFGEGTGPLLEAGSLFAFTLIPIALVYDLAHFYAYIVIQSQGIIPLLADPLHRGWHLIDSKGYKTSFALADAGFVWYLQVVLIVLGHVVAVYLAHVRALSLYRRVRVALRSQYPMLVLMILYTATSLWIIAQPNVEHG